MILKRHPTHVAITLIDKPHRAFPAFRLVIYPLTASIQLSDVYEAFHTLPY